MQTIFSRCQIVIFRQLDRSYLFLIFLLKKQLNSISILIERILKIEVSNSSFNIYDFQVNFGREENEKNQIEQIMDDKFECNRENNVNDL